MESLEWEARMGFGKAVSTCLGKFFTFAGRAPRSEYWFFYLFFLICVIAGAVFDVLLGTATFDEDGDFEAGILAIVAVLILFFPQLSVSVRRLHDIGRSGWWLWLSLIPFVGPLVLLVWNCSRGTEGENRFGPNPLHPVPVSVFD